MSHGIIHDFISCLSCRSFITYFKNPFINVSWAITAGWRQWEAKLGTQVPSLADSKKPCDNLPERSWLRWSKNEHGLTPVGITPLKWGHELPSAMCEYHRAGNSEQRHNHAQHCGKQCLAIVEQLFCHRNVFVAFFLPLRLAPGNELYAFLDYGCFLKGVCNRIVGWILETTSNWGAPPRIMRV